MISRIFTEINYLLPWRRPRKTCFEEHTDRALKRFKKFSPSQTSKASQAIGILVTPWGETAVPFFSLEIACKLAHEGHYVQVIWDSVDTFGNASRRMEIKQIERVLDEVRRHFTIVSPLDFTPGSTPDPAFFPELLLENAIKKVGGETGAEEFIAEHPAQVDVFRRHIRQVSALLQASDFKWILIPGGAWATGSVYAAVARVLALEFTTFDCGQGSLFVAHNAIAAHFSEIQAGTMALKKMLPADSSLQEEIVSGSQEQLKIRMSGLDDFRLQPIASAGGSGNSWDILVPLNLRWDSAALCRQNLFPMVGAWLRELLTWLRSHPKVTMAIRQHPCERLPGCAGVDDYGAIVAEYSDLKERVCYFAADEIVNSYDLILGAKVVLPYTSRIGIEAAILGKPVILHARCYYGNCGFASTPASRAEYFSQIENALSDNIVVDDEAVTAATIAFYLTERHLEVRTLFTPAAADFSTWSEIPPQTLWNDPANSDFFKALVSRKALVRIRFDRAMEEKGIAVRA